MRSDRRRGWCGRVRTAVVALSAVVAVGCGGSGEERADAPTPTDGERAACAQVQELVDAIVAGEAVSAMSNLAELESALAESGNRELSSNGSAFFATISDTVPDPGSLTVEESSAVGDQALAEAQPTLGALLDECAAVGLAITNLPTGDRP
jgi:hypothetical protein